MIFTTVDNGFDCDGDPVSEIHGTFMLFGGVLFGQRAPPQGFYQLGAGEAQGMHFDFDLALCSFAVAAPSIALCSLQPCGRLWLLDWGLQADICG